MAKAWRSGELYGGGGTQSVSFDPLGTRVIVGGDTNGPKVSYDDGVNWVQACGGYDDDITGQQLQTSAVLWSRTTSTPNRVWNGNKAGVMVSNNAGLDWVSVKGFPGQFNHGSDNRPRFVGHMIDDDGIGHLYVIDNPGNVYRYNISGADGSNPNSVAGAWTKIASTPGGNGSGLCLDPVDSTILYVSTYAGIYQLEGIRTGGLNSATVRSFTGTGSPTGRCEEIIAVNESGTVKVYVAAYNAVKRVQKGGGTGNITNAFDTITPSTTSSMWNAIDAVRSAGSTLLVIGCANPTATGNGFGQVWYAVNGQAGSPTWTCLTADNAASDYVNAMGGAGGKPWWGDGLRPGAKQSEKSANRWVTGGGGVESIAFDPAHTNIIIAAGQNGNWMFDTAAKKCYPSQTGIHSAVCTKNVIDPTDDDHIFSINNDHCGLFTKTGGFGGDWHKNENNTGGGTTAFYDGSLIPTSGRWFVVFGERESNINGEVFWNDDPVAGNDWQSLGKMTGGVRPMGIAARRISGSDVVVIAVNNGGILKRTFTTATPPTSGTGWVKKEAVAFSSMTGKYKRPFDIYWATNTLMFAYDCTDGIWRSTDAGESWSRIWACPCNDDRHGYILMDPDDVNSMYVSLGTPAATANEGLWKLTGANTGTVEAGTITKTELKRPGGVSFIDPTVIAAAPGGLFAICEMGTKPNPKAFYSTNSGATFTDVTDPYFERSARKVYGASMTSTGRWFVGMNGPAMIVYDDFTSAGGDSTGGGPGPDPQPATIVRTTKLQWAVTDPSGTVFVSDPLSAPIVAVDSLLVAHVFNSDSAAADPPTSLTGLGLTWTQRQTRNLVVSDLTERQITTFTALSDTAGATGSLTVTFPTAQNGCAVHLTEYQNVDIGMGGTPTTVSMGTVSGTTVTNDTNNVTAYTVGPFTPSTTGSVLGLVIAAVDQAADATPVITSVADDHGRAYTLVDSQAVTSTDFYKLFFYTAPTGTANATTITVTFNANLTGCNLQVVEFVGADATNPVPTGQHAVQTNATTPNVSLPVAPAASSMVLWASQIRRVPAGWTEEAGWTRVTSSSHISPNNGFQVATKTADQTFTATGTNGTQASLIVEIQGVAGSTGDPVIQEAASTWGSTLSRPTISLPNPVAKPANAVESASVTTRNPANWDPELGWDELWDSGYASPLTGAHVVSALALGDQTFAAAGGVNARWAGSIYEIAAAAGGGVVGGVEVAYDMDYVVGKFQDLDYDLDFMPLTVSLNRLTSGSSDTDASSYVTASVTPTSGRAVYAFVETAMSNGATPAQPTATGAGLTWAVVRSLVYDAGTDVNRRRMTLFKGTGTPSAGAVTFAFAGTGTSPYPTEVLADTPTGYWKLNETAAGTIADSSGNGLNGTIIVPGSGVVATYAVPGLVAGTDTAIRLNEREAVNLSNPTALRFGSAAWSLEAWVNVPVGQPNAGAVIAQRYDGSTINYMLGFYDGAAQTLKPTVGFFNGSWRLAQAASNISLGVAHHIVGTWSGPGGVLRIYVDGVLAASNTPGSNPSASSTQDFHLAHRWDDPGGVINPFHGDLDEAAIYNYELNATRIAAHYAAGTGAVVAQTQTHGNWILVESSGGTVLQTVSASAPVSGEISTSITPVRPTTTILSFVSKKGDQPLNATDPAEEIVQVANAAPFGVSMGMVAGLASPATIGATTSDLKDIGIISVELSSLSTSAEVSYAMDYNLSGTVVVAPGTTRPRRSRRLSQVFATIKGTELPLQEDFEFSETAMGGYDRAKLSVPERYARTHPGLIQPDVLVSFWNEAGSELWTGVIQRPPEFRDGLAVAEAAGAQYDARGISDRLLYQAVGTEGWSSADSDPYDYQISKSYNVSVEEGRLLMERSKDETFNDGTRAGWVFWADGADISRVAFIIQKSQNAMGNHDIKLLQADGPNNSLVEVASWPLDAGNPPGTEKIKDHIGGNHDMVSIMVRANSSFTSQTHEHIWLQDIRVNDIADNDTFTTTQVAKDIANRLGWDTSHAAASDFNALPYDVESDDWGTALDYISQLDDMPWQAYCDFEGQVMFRRRAWDADDQFVSFESGTTADLSPEPIYDQVSVVYEGLSGKKHTVTARQGPGRILPPIELSDPQRNSEGAEHYADRLLLEFGVERYTGNITMFDGHREIHAGRRVVLTDWAPEDPLGNRISDVTQTFDNIKVGIRTPQIVSRWLARFALRSARRAAGRR